MIKVDKEKRTVLIIAFIALCLLIIAYANHFNNGFHFDDVHAVVNNLYIRNIHNIPAFFVDPKMFSADPTHWGLRSLVTTSLAVDYWLGGSLDPFWFQMSTFIWHIFLCVVLYFLYNNLLKHTFSGSWPSYLAIAGAAWYALHTANAETLNYIISRSDVLSTLMITSSLFIYIALPLKRKYYLYIIPAILGVFAKETVLVLVILLFFYILLFEKEFSLTDLFRKKKFKTVLNVIVQLLPITILIIIVQVYALTRITSIPGISNPLLPYILTETYVWLHYVITFFMPVNLSADSDWGVFSNAFDDRILIGCVFIGILMFTIIKTSRKKETRVICFGLIWFSAALLPTSLAPFAEVTNDHRMYFPFIGLALSVVAYAGILIRRYQNYFVSKYYYTGILAVLFTILVLNAYGVRQRNEVWHDEDSLWADVAIKSPANGRGLMNYGVAEMRRGNYDNALHYFKRALVYAPTYGLIYINLGTVNGMLHKQAEAEANFNTAIAFDAGDFYPYLSFAQYLNNHGKINEAKIMAEKAFQLNPYSEQAIYTLTQIDIELDQWAQAEAISTHFLSIAPNNANAKTSLYAAQKHIPEFFDNANNTFYITKSPDDYIDLSLLYYNSGLYLKSIDACNTALKLKPNCDLAYSNIGAAYLKLGQYNHSIEACTKAVALNPKNIMAKNNLLLAQSQLKK